MIEYEELIKERDIARAELDAGVSSLLTLGKKLKEGVSYDDAVLIVKQFWDKRDAGQIQALLLNSFPERNGEIILEKNIDSRVAEKLSIVTSVKFFDDAFAYINQEMIRVMEKFKAHLTEDTHDFVKFMEFRKDTARYVAFMDWGAYDLKDHLINGCNNWEDLPPTVNSIETGDYMLWDNPAVNVIKVHEEFKERHLNRKDYISLGSLDYCFDSVICSMELALLFARTLKEL